MTVTDVPVYSDEKATVFPQDESPIDSDALYCEVCGVEIPYAGRGRKPRKCEQHRRPSGSATRSSAGRKTLGKNEALAAQATEALCQVNGLITLGVMATGLPATASAIQTADEGFREQAYAALLTDPALCQTILRAGTASGKVSLLIAYGMLAAAVTPVAMLEIKEKREAKREAMAEVEAG